MKNPISAFKTVNISRLIRGKSHFIIRVFFLLEIEFSKISNEFDGSTPALILLAV